MNLNRRDVILGAGALGLAAGPAGQASAGTGFDMRIVQSGHSLTDGIMAPLGDFRALRGTRRGGIEKSTIPGSPMDWRWNNGPGPDSVDIRQPLQMARFDMLVLTERVPLSVTVPYHNSAATALLWAEHAWRYGRESNGAPTVLYASWIEVTSGPDFANEDGDPEGNIPFRDRLPLEMARWEEIRAYVNAEGPADMARMKMIPGPLVLAAAHDDIVAGRAPGLSATADLFHDEIHLNDLGNYLIALAHFAVIYDADPRGLPPNIPPRTGPNQAQAGWMQDLVWRVLTDYRAAEA